MVQALRCYFSWTCVVVVAVAAAFIFLNRLHVKSYATNYYNQLLYTLGLGKRKLIVLAAMYLLTLCVLLLHAWRTHMLPRGRLHHAITTFIFNVQQWIKSKFFFLALLCWKLTCILGWRFSSASCCCLNWFKVGSASCPVAWPSNFLEWLWNYYFFSNKKCFEWWRPAADCSH